MDRVIWLWAHPRSRSTAVLRMMLERGDVTVVHEPLVSLHDAGEVVVTDGAGGVTVLRSVPAVLDHVRALARQRPVFVKDTVEHRYGYLFEHPHEVAGIRHTFIVREPRAAIAALVATEPDLRCADAGYEHQHELFELAWWLSGREPVVLDADRLVRDPERVVAAYCAAVGLPFLPQAMRWQAADRPEWHRTRPWVPRRPADLDAYRKVRALCAHHRPFYDSMARHAL
ncbi:MAG TPA: hypothetical protein VE547_04935 [Mycobacteriales bacterium]|jgi:hypothetical protein|nr:hypothetical protein [Mycobacteriales bacterium]